MPRDRLYLTVTVSDDPAVAMDQLVLLFARLVPLPFEVSVTVVSKHTDPPPDRWVEGPPSGG